MFPFLKLKTSVNVLTTCSPLFVFGFRHKRVSDIKWLYAELYQLTWWSNLLLFRRIPNWSQGPNRLCSWVVHSPFHSDVTQGTDGSVVERLGPRAWNSVILGSSPIELFSSLAAVRQLFSSLARHASGQLADFALVESPVSFLLNKSCRLIVSWNLREMFPTEERFTGLMLQRHCGQIVHAHFLHVFG